jgi:hypothetical protein
MWTLDEELERHFERIRARSGNSDDEDDEAERGGMMQNEYAKNRGRHLR